MPHCLEIPSSFLENKLRVKQTKTKSSCSLNFLKIWPICSLFLDLTDVSYVFSIYPLVIPCTQMLPLECLAFPFHDMISLTSPTCSLPSLRCWLLAFIALSSFDCLGLFLVCLFCFLVLFLCLWSVHPPPTCCIDRGRGGGSCWMHVADVAD